MRKKTFLVLIFLFFLNSLFAKKEFDTVIFLGVTQYRELEKPTDPSFKLNSDKINQELGTIFGINYTFFNTGNFDWEVDYSFSSQSYPAPNKNPQVISFLPMPEIKYYEKNTSLINQSIGLGFAYNLYQINQLKLSLKLSINTNNFEIRRTFETKGTNPDSETTLIDSTNTSIVTGFLITYSRIIFILKYDPFIGKGPVGRYSLLSMSLGWLF